MRDQIGHIAAELRRLIDNSPRDKDFRFQILERIIDLIDLSLNDYKWRVNPLPLLVLRNYIAEAYKGNEVDLKNIYAAL